MSNLRYIICIETGTDTCSVALAAGGVLVALRESHGERDHAARVAVFAAEVLAEAGIEARELAAVAVSKGPGSYTGLRIGVSFAKGLCYGLGVPLIGVGSLASLCAEAIRYFEQQHNFGFSSEAGGCKACDGTETAVYSNVNEDFGDKYNAADTCLSRKTFIPMIDARRMEVFAQVFDAEGNALTPPEALIIDENSLAEYRPGANATDREVYIFGSGAEKCREALPWAHCLEVGPSARGMVPLAFAALEAGRFENTAYFEPFYLKDFVITTSKKKLF